MARGMEISYVCTICYMQKFFGDNTYQWVTVHTDPQMQSCWPVCCLISFMKLRGWDRLGRHAFQFSHLGCI